MKALTAFVLAPLAAKSNPRLPRDPALPILRKLLRPRGGKDMKVPSVRAAYVAVAVAVCVILSFSTPSFAAEEERFQEVQRAQALYEYVLRLEKGGPLRGPYTAPLHTNPTGTSYLWGGLDPISILDRYDQNIGADRGKVLFISRSGSDIGNPEFFLELPTYPGSPVSKRALFRSAENRDRFVRMTNTGSLMIMFGMNCQWGVIAGPASGFASKSHWAQPGLAAIAVERFLDGRVTVLGVNLYSRGDDWSATSKRWRHAIQAFESLLTHDEQWTRERPEMPLIKVN